VKTVMVVDPYAAGRAAISAAIAELGYRVVAAATAAEGRPIIERGGIDVIVADADDADIRALITRLPARGVSIPSVMLTAWRLVRSAVPNTTMLEKPTGLDALSTALADALHADRPFDLA